MSAVVTHTDRPHAPFGASGAHRWTVCGPSAIAWDDVEDVPTRWSLEGTAAHELGQMCLENDQDAIEWVDRKINDILIDADFADALQGYLDECRKYMVDGWVWWIEKSISLEALNPPEPMYGTGDFCAYNAELRLLVVVDLKFGQWKIVEAEGNPQIKYYALATWLSLPPDMLVESILGTIVQPRASTGAHVKSATFDPLELMEWSAWLFERAKAAREPDAPYRAGDHCKFCKGDGRCVPQANANLAFAISAAADDFDYEPLTVDNTPAHPRLIDPRHMTSEQFQRVLDAGNQFTTWYASVKDLAKDGIERGWLTVPGWKVIPTEQRQHWTSAEEAAVAKRLIAEHHFTPDEVWTKKIVSPAQARAVIVAGLREGGLKKKDAEPVAKQQLASMVKSESSGTKLVPATAEGDSVAVRGSEFDLLPSPE